MIIIVKPIQNLIIKQIILAKAIILIRRLLRLANNKREKMAAVIAKGLGIVNIIGKKI